MSTYVREESQPNTTEDCDGPLGAYEIARPRRPIASAPANARHSRSAMVEQVAPLSARIDAAPTMKSQRLNPRGDDCRPDPQKKSHAVRPVALRLPHAAQGNDRGLGRPRELHRACLPNRRMKLVQSSELVQHAVGEGHVQLRLLSAADPVTPEDLSSPKNEMT